MISHGDLNENSKFKTKKLYSVFLDPSFVFKNIDIAEDFYAQFRTGQFFDICYVLSFCHLNFYLSDASFMLFIELVLCIASIVFNAVYSHLPVKNAVKV